MGKKTTQITKSTQLTKPTRELVQFLYWLKAGMKYKPDAVVMLGSISGKSALSLAFSDAEQISIPKPDKSIEGELKGKYEGRKLFLTSHCGGNDLNILRASKKVLACCDVVVIKTALYRYTGPKHADFYDVVAFMKKNNFVVFDMLEGLFKPSNRALGQIDLVFVKEKGSLRPNHWW